MRTAAVLPVKRFSLAKRRLGESVADGLRLELVQAMVADVLGALARTRSSEVTIVVTRERAVARAASEVGAVVLDDVPEAGQSAAAALGVRHAISEGIERVLCIPGDCPALDPAELEVLLSAHAGGAGGAPEVVIVPDRHGTGTNGLLLSPPDAIPPSFGPGSFQRHRALALAAGVACRVERPASLLLDIDTGADLATLRERAIPDPAGRGSPLGMSTRAVLEAAEQASILPLTTSA
jgi:2-phospho-L-lactate guanylyltransferase